MDVFFLTDDNGNLFQFDSFGDAPPRYSIANYQKHENNDTYYWRQVGTYISKFSSLINVYFFLLFFKSLLNKYFYLKFSICVTYLIAIYYFHFLKLHISSFLLSILEIN